MRLEGVIIFFLRFPLKMSVEVEMCTISFISSDTHADMKYIYDEISKGNNKIYLNDAFDGPHIIDLNDVTYVTTQEAMGQSVEYIANKLNKP